ncbi:conserved hypothetical protein, partial [Ricinus communis]
MQVGAADIAAVVTGQEQRGAGDFLRPPQATERDLAGQRGAHVVADAVEHRCIGRPGAEGVHADAARRQFLSPGAGVGPHRRLRCRIRGIAGIGDGAGNRTDQHDGPALFHLAGGALHGQHHGAHVQVEGAVDMFLGDLIQRRVFGDAGRGDQNIEPFRPFGQRREQAIKVGGA